MLIRESPRRDARDQLRNLVPLLRDRTQETRTLIRKQFKTTRRQLILHLTMLQICEALILRIRVLSDVTSNIGDDSRRFEEASCRFSSRVSR